MATEFEDLVQSQPNPNQMSAPVPPTEPVQSSASMASPEQVAELGSLLKNVQNANSKLVSASIIDRNKISSVRKDLMNKIFGLMKQAGVDLSNPESIRSFMEKLSKESPDLLAMFEMAFQGLNSNPTDATPASSPEEMEQGMAEDENTPMPLSSSNGEAPAENPVVERFQNLSRMGS